MYKTIKNSRIIQRFGKVILSLLLLIIIGYQFSTVDWQQFKKIELSRPFFFILSFVLIGCNLSLEYSKWHLVINQIQKDTSLKTRISSFFAGTATAFITPNLLGNFIGRMFYFQRMYRGKIIAYTFLSNGAQFISSIIGGVISILFLGNKVTSLKYLPIELFIVGVILFLLIYFVFDIALKKHKKFKRIGYHLQNTILLRIKFILISFARHLIFTTQYVCILVSFGVNFEAEIYFYVFQIFFWTTLIPSVWIGKLFIRESVALYLLSTIISSGAIIISSAFIVWCLNQVLPTLVALIFLRKKNESLLSS